MLYGTSKSCRTGHSENYQIFDINTVATTVPCPHNIENAPRHKENDN